MFRLQEILDERDMKQKELSDALNLPKQTVHNYAACKRQPDFDTLNLICDFFGVTADYLLGRSSNPAAAISDEDAALLRAFHAAPPSVVAGIQALLQPYMEEDKADQAI